MLTTANLIAIACILILSVGDLTIVDARLEDNVTQHNTSLNGPNSSEPIGDSEAEGTVKNKSDIDSVKSDNYTAENKTKSFLDESKIENKTVKLLVKYTTITTEINTVNTYSAKTREATSENTSKTMYEDNYTYKNGENYKSEENARFEIILVRQPFDNNMPENIPEYYTGLKMMKARESKERLTEKKARTVLNVSVAEEIGFIKENVTKYYINNNKTGSNPDNSALRCLWCNSRTVFGCYDPLGQKVAVRKCEVSTSLCFTRFGADGEEVERDCFSQQAVDVTHACSSHLCNDIPASSIPLIYNRVVWKDYMRSLYIFMKRNTIPLRCVSCESSEFYPNTGPNFTAKSYDDDCINPPKDRVENMSVVCLRNELCETARVRGHVTRGCARAPHDSAFLVCAEDECNNHVDIVQEYHYRKLQYPTSRSKGWKLLSNDIIVNIYCFIIFYKGSQ